MINIASIYHFSLLQRISQKQKDTLTRVVENIKVYLDSENISHSLKTKQVWEYTLSYFKLWDWFASIQFFHKTSKKRDLYYFPYMFCEIYIEKKYLESKSSQKRSIFLLSNIFECFDEYEEKNTMIEFHKDIYETFNNNKQYYLRHDFLDINSLSSAYDGETISKNLTKFIENNHAISQMSQIKQRFPDTYRTLLFFVFNIFALQKSFVSTDNKLNEIREIEMISWENAHISLSHERLKLNRKTLETTLNLYKTNFENFMKIMVKK